MKRDLIAIVGNQGFGKSVWAKLYSERSPRLFVSDPMASYPGVDFLSDPGDFWEAYERGEKKTFRFGTYHREELPMFGSMAFASGNCTLIVEECALMFPRGKPLEEWANRIIFMGRHAQVNLLMLAQRAVAIPLDIRSQATRVITFRQTEPDDADAISEKIGKQYYDRIMALPELTCLDWENGNVREYPIRPG